MSHKTPNGTTVTHIFGNGHKFVVRYWNADKEKVISEALNAVKNIDPCRFPYKDNVYSYGVGWAVDVTYYGVE